MQEKDLNHDLIHKFNEIGWGYKIPDPSQGASMSSSKRPFDGIAFFPEMGAIFFESKLIKHKIQAFSLNRVEEHQYDNLLKLQSLGANSFVILGIWIPRKEYWFLMFDPLFLFNLKNKRKSILAKELAWYKENNYAVNLKNTFFSEYFISKKIDFLPEEMCDR